MGLSKSTPLKCVSKEKTVLNINDKVVTSEVPLVFRNGGNGDLRMSDGALWFRNQKLKGVEHNAPCFSSDLLELSLKSNNLVESVIVVPWNVKRLSGDGYLMGGDGIVALKEKGLYWIIARVSVGMREGVGKVICKMRLERSVKSIDVKNLVKNGVDNIGSDDLNGHHTLEEFHSYDVLEKGCGTLSINKIVTCAAGDMLRISLACDVKNGVRLLGNGSNLTMVRLCS